MTTLNRPRPSLDPPGDPVKAPAWKNLWFLKDGTTRIPLRTWPSEAIAKQMFEEFLAEHLAGINPETGRPWAGWKGVAFREGKDVRNEQLSHAIQIPWLKE